MRLLLSAFACYPGLGSEPNIGWNMALEMARQNSVWVLTDAANRVGIESATGISPLSNLHFIYISLPRWIKRAGVLEWVYYALWQIKAFWVARRLHQSVKFDAALHITYVTSWMPTWLGWLGIPFLWCAGTRASTPWSFLGQMSVSSAIREIIRNLALATLGRINILLARKPNTWVISSSSQQDWKGTRLVPFALGGLSEDELSQLASVSRHYEGIFRVASVGRFIGWKGFNMGLRAFATLHQQFPQSEYWLIGDGPDKEMLQRLAQKLGIETAVKFLPWQSRQELFRLLGSIDVLLHPSLHEQFGYVILEAMAAGRPVVCLDVGGASFLVDEKCGFKITVSSPQQVVEDMGTALLQLALQPTLKLQMGEAARLRAYSYSWKIIAKRIEMITLQMVNEFSGRGSAVIEPYPGKDNFG